MDDDTFRRTVTADPENDQALIARLSNRSRIEGADVYLEALADIDIWRKAPRIVQDLAINEVSSRLHTGPWEARPTKTFTQAVVKRSAGKIIGGKSISHRVGIFFHKPTRSEFSLIPGRYCDDLRVNPSGTKERDCVSCCGPILIGRTPITREQYNLTAGSAASPSVRNMIDDDIPVTDRDLKRIVGWLNHFDDGLRLPNEYEWRHFSRAGSDALFYFGDKLDLSHAWVRENSLGIEDLSSLSGDAYVSIGGHQAHGVNLHMDEGKWNAFGLVDIIGNVWERAQSFDTRRREVMNGLSFFSGMEEDMEDGNLDDIYLDEIGFRVACDIPDLS